MGFRVGTKVGNTYVSTNGKNIRTTTKVSKNVYYTHQIGHKTRKRKQNSSDGTLAALIIMIITMSIMWCIINSIL